MKFTPEHHPIDNSGIPVSAAEFSPCLEERLRQVQDGTSLNGVDPKDLLEKVNHEMYAEGEDAGSPEFKMAACGLARCSRMRGFERQGDFIATIDTDVLDEEFPCVEGNPTVILEFPSEDEMNILGKKPNRSLPFLGA